MLEGLSFRFLLALGAAVVIPASLFIGLDALNLGYAERASRWSLLDVSDDGRVLTISSTVSTCESRARIEKSESAETVRIRFVVRRPPLADCEDGDALRADVRLERPLAGRMLVDQHTGSRPEIIEQAPPWTLLGISESRRTLTISFVGSSCDGLNRVERRETPRAISVKVSVRPSLEGGCISDVRRRTEVALARALDRDLIDPRTGQPPPGLQEASRR
jgi:hypothetical protein